MKLIQIDATDALVVVDMQRDFGLPTGALFVAGIPGEATMEEVIDRIDHLSIKPFGYLVVTGDKHPASGHVEYEIYGRHCVANTPGADYIAGLFPVSSLADFRLVKGGNAALISYSAAMSEDFGRLISELRAKGIKRIFVCGLAYTHCVGETAIDLAKQSIPVPGKSWEVFVVRDATRSVPLPHGDACLMKKRLAMSGVKEIRAAKLGV